MSQFNHQSTFSNDSESYMYNIRTKCLIYSKNNLSIILLKSMYEYKNNSDDNIRIVVKKDGRDIIFKLINDTKGFQYQSRHNCDNKNIALIESKYSKMSDFIKIFHKNINEYYTQMMVDFENHMKSRDELLPNYNPSDEMTIEYLIELIPTHHQFCQIRFKKITPKMIQGEYNEERMGRVIVKKKSCNHNKCLIVPNIKLDGDYSDYNGIFLHYVDYKLDQIVKSSNKELMKLMKKNRKVYLNETTDSDECCICYELTNMKTYCNHTLCKDCYDELNDKICPLCRTNLKDEIIQEQKEETNDMIMVDFVGDSDLSDTDEEQPIIHEEQKEEIISEQKEEPIEEEEIINENPKYYNIEEEELFNNYILNETEMTINGSQYKLYYFKIEITDNQLTKLFPTIMRNPKIEMLCNLRMGYIEVSVEIN